LDDFCAGECGAEAAAVQTLRAICEALG